MKVKKIQFYITNKYLVIPLIAILIFVTQDKESQPIFLSGQINSNKNKNPVFNDAGCMLCNIQPQLNNGDSSESDLILTFATNKITNLHAFVSSCRSVGCKATIVLLIDKNTISKYDTEYFMQLKNCGVEIVEIVELSETDRTNIFFIRYIYFKKYLDDNKDRFKRVIISDIYDAIFQHDPFTKNFTADKVYFSSEHQKLKTNKYNRLYIKQCFDNLYRIDSTKKADKDLESVMFTGDIINCGLYAGGMKYIRKFIDYMIKLGDPVKQIAYSDDQGCLNLFLRGKFFDDIFPYEIEAGNGTFITSMGNTFFYKSKYMKNKHVGEFQVNEKTPAMLHQVNRCYYIAKDIKNVCPANVHNYNLYVPPKMRHGKLWTFYFNNICTFPDSVHQVTLTSVTLLTILTLFSAIMLNYESKRHWNRFSSRRF